MNMMKIREMVEQDLKFENEKLDHESLRIPQLHSKYLNFLTEEKIILNKYKNEYSCLYKTKWEYYNGKMSEEDLKKNQWEQFDLKILKSDVSIYMNSDEDLIRLNEKILLQSEKVNYLESILKMILNRQFHIRDAIAWRKFLNGVI
jgi:hypothetical protein